MITDPYQVLGISPNASDDEVKKAYRELSRKYHPDTNANNPLADLAEEKFKQVQEAYQQITNDREHGGHTSYGQGYSQNSTYQTGSSYAGQEDPKMMAAANYINSGNFREALNVLTGVSNRTSHWYYFNAVAHARLGNNIEAVKFARQAVNMEPNNREYNEFLDRLQWGRQRYQSNGTGYGYGGNGDSSCGTGNLCCDLCIADQLCECMGGDLCSCM